MAETFRSGALASLKQFVRKPSEKLEVCELCAAPLAARHDHLLELEQRRVTCACPSCAILFDRNTRQRFHRIPRDVYRFRNFSIDEFEWESLLIPINLAFFVYNSAAGKMVAMYPSPAGVVESALDLEFWNAIAKRNPALSRMEPDVEALLANRVGSEPLYFRVPIDQCFRLVGTIRKHWRGLSGGTEVWKEVDRFFAELARMSIEEQHA
jgi:hypothetical protein